LVTRDMKSCTVFRERDELIVERYDASRLVYLAHRLDRWRYG
jgi:hypothetical protein